MIVVMMTLATSSFTVGFVPAWTSSPSLSSSSLSQALYPGHHHRGLPDPGWARTDSCPSCRVHRHRQNLSEVAVYEQ